MSIAAVSPINKKRKVLNQNRRFFQENTLKASPVVRASHLWKIVSDQLECLFGETIHNQWFSPIIPIVVANNVLILKTPNDTATRWINAHYQPLIDKLLQIHDRELSAFCLSSQDIEENSK